MTSLIITIKKTDTHFAIKDDIKQVVETKVIPAIEKLGLEKTIIVTSIVELLSNESCWNNKKLEIKKPSLDELLEALFDSLETITQNYNAKGKALLVLRNKKNKEIYGSFVIDKCEEFNYKYDDTYNFDIYCYHESITKVENYIKYVKSTSLKDKTFKMKIIYRMFGLRDPIKSTIIDVVTDKQYVRDDLKSMENFVSRIIDEEIDNIDHYTLSRHDFVMEGKFNEKRMYVLELMFLSFGVNITRCITKSSEGSRSVCCVKIGNK